MNIGENYDGNPFLNDPPLVVESRFTEKGGGVTITLTEMTREQRRYVVPFDYSIDGGKRQEIAALNQRYYWHTPRLIGYTRRGGCLWLLRDYTGEVSE